MDLYDRITQLLSEKGISRRKLAKDIDIPYQSLSSLFNRRSEKVSLDLIQDIAKYLGTTVDYLAFGESEKPNAKDVLITIFDSLDDSKKNELVNYARYLQNKDN